MPLVRKSSAPPPPPSSGSLSSDVASERWAAARAMNRAIDVEALSATLAVERDANVREAILTSLTQIATPESAAAVLPGVRSDDASIRRAAIDALSSMPQAAAPHLPGLLTDDDADVRLLTCEIVRHLPSAEATRMLTQVLARDTEVNVCTSAVEVLAEIGGADALPGLEVVERRFPGEDFLLFAIEAARQRIAGSTGRE